MEGKQQKRIILRFVNLGRVFQQKTDKFGASWEEPLHFIVYASVRDETPHYSVAPKQTTNCSRCSLRSFVLGAICTLERAARGVFGQVVATASLRRYR